MVHNYRYEALLGYFAHDDLARDPHLPAVPPRFGLNDDSQDRWPKFFQQIRQLNEDAPPGIAYKFFLLSRHGQGYHNVAESKYGTIAWDAYWSKLNGDGEIVWGPDPKLTPLGIEQAQAIHDAWTTEAKYGLFAPHKRFTSPLTRALHTASIISNGVFETYPNGIYVMENCREQLGVHTCDKRKSRSYISSAFPTFEIDSSLTEEDEHWKANIRETPLEVSIRAKGVLDYVFHGFIEATFISITAHGGFMNGFLNAVGRESMLLPTGSVLPIIVRAVPE